MRKVKGGGLLESISAFIAERYYKRLHSGTCSRIRRELNPKSFDSFCSWKHVTAGSTAGPSAGKQWRETVQGFSHIKTALFFFSPDVKLVSHQACSRHKEKDLNRPRGAEMLHAT